MSDETTSSAGGEGEWNPRLAILLAMAMAPHLPGKTPRTWTVASRLSPFDRTVRSVCERAEDRGHAIEEQWVDPENPWPSIVLTSVRKPLALIVMGSHRAIRRTNRQPPPRCPLHEPPLRKSI